MFIVAAQRIWHKSVITKYHHIITILVIGLIAFSLSASGSEADYQKILAQSQVETKPSNHAALAQWCQKNYPAKYKYHFDQYNLYQFKLKEEKLPENPSKTQLAAMYSLALKIDSQEMYVKYHDQWGRLMLAEKMESLKDGDSKKLQSILIWLIENDLSHMSESIELSEKYFQANPGDEKMRRYLNFIKLDDTWVQPTNLDEKWYTDSDLRVQLHEQLSLTEKAKGPPKRVWESDPIKNFATLRGCKVKGTNASNGESRYLIYANPTRDPSKPRPLVISFHGGGSGGTEELSEEQASIALMTSNNLVPDAVVLAPIAKIHINNSWGHKSNVKDWLDALEEICQMYPIDRKRIYLYGYSMGSKAIQSYCWVAPEFGAAYALGGCSTGAGPMTDKSFKGKPFLIAHGLKEASFRTSMKNKLVERIKEGGALLEVYDFPDYGHELPHTMYHDQLAAMFTRTVNPIEPNIGVIRHLFLSRFKEIKDLNSK